ncbi:PR domain zinc finger protein 5-like [Pecten maximus]|uniref:PR domain zinc finger protein 5-like n=1 Tax=Pecten maximus TaxID=6579 RepID=UPI001458FE60|nr:PR domain zinc finger protein 5-like [Pecten maximus]
MSSIEEITIRYANPRFSNLDELRKWADDLGIIHFPAIINRISDLQALEGDPMDIQSVDQTIYTSLLEIDDPEEVKERAKFNNLGSHEMAAKRIRELCEHCCEHCTSVFTRKSSLARHMESVHARKAFECHKCEKKFSSNFNRVRQQKMCTEKTLILRSFNCSVCNASLPTLAELKKHSVFHIQEHNREFEPMPGPSREPMPGPSHESFPYILSPCPLSDSESDDETTAISAPMSSKKIYL